MTEKIQLHFGVSEFKEKDEFKAWAKSMDFHVVFHGDKMVVRKDNSKFRHAIVYELPFLSEEEKTLVVMMFEKYVYFYEQS